MKKPITTPQSAKKPGAPVLPELKSPGYKIGPFGPLCLCLFDCYPRLERKNGSTTGRLQERAEYTDGPTPRQALIELSFLRFITGLREAKEPKVNQKMGGQPPFPLKS
ncbi:MAG: hypothetical protein CMG46_13775 [Candidatus Marinimicrobia bacterium]|nr:hypothetical protein [Candidatus Neomarinimicrobiota bacterium]